MREAGTAEFVAFFFRANGRIGRMEYVHGALFIWAVNMALLVACVNHTDIHLTGPALMVLAGVPSSIAFLTLAVKRCHDLALPGSFILLIVVPAVGLVWLIALMFVPGNAGPNLYGPAPRFRPD